LSDLLWTPESQNDGVASFLGETYPFNPEGRSSLYVQIVVPVLFLFDLSLRPAMAFFNPAIDQRRKKLLIIFTSYLIAKKGEP